MKFALLVASLGCLFFLSGCADTSLMTDEEYRNSRGPAPFSPDYSNVLPDPNTGRPAGGF